MAFDFRRWIETFKQQLGFNDAKAYGVIIDHRSAALWQVIGVHHLSGDENNGNHNVFLDVLDEDGLRVYGAHVSWGWNDMRSDEKPGDVVIDKPTYEPGGNLAMHKGQKVFCYIPGDRSDYVKGLHIGHADEGDGNTWGHHSFYVVFQKVNSSAPPELPEPDPDPVQQQVGGVQVTVNVDWINSLRQDQAGQVTFFVPVTVRSINE